MKLRNLGKLTASLATMGALSWYSTGAFSGPTCPETSDPASDYQCVFFDVDTDFDSDGDTTTSAFYELGYTGTLATSIYEEGLAAGSSVFDSNITQILNYYGLSGSGTYTALDGTTSQSLKDTPDFPGETNIDALNGPSPKNTEFFDADNTFSGQGWGLTYQYYFKGTLTSTGPEYTGGYIDFFFQDWKTNTAEQVLRVNVTGSSLATANLNIFGEITFDWTGGGTDIYGLNSIGDGTNDCTTALCQDFFNFQTSIPTDFFSLEGLGVEIVMTLDTNVNPPYPSDNQLVEFTGDDGEKYWIRQTTLDGSVRFIPEPVPLLLLGAGLLGLGFHRVQRKSS